MSAVRRSKGFLEMKAEDKSGFRIWRAGVDASAQCSSAVAWTEVVVGAHCPGEGEW